jgi:hypothetical protein
MRVTLPDTSYRLGESMTVSEVEARDDVTYRQHGEVATFSDGSRWLVDEDGSFYVCQKSTRFGGR